MRSRRGDRPQQVNGASTSDTKVTKRLATTPERSFLLSRVRQRGTAPEVVVRQMLNSLGHAYRVNARGIPGSPDVVAVDNSRVVFVHGCYWHRHNNCPGSSTPKHNSAFWLAKFAANVRRDRRNTRELRKLGYRIMTVWECETKSAVKRPRLVGRLNRFFRNAR